MAPRTREQQDAYNEKRRSEAALARAAKATPKGKAPAKAKAKANGHAKPTTKAAKPKTLTSGEALTRKIGKGPYGPLGLPKPKVKAKRKSPAAPVAAEVPVKAKPNPPAMAPVQRAILSDHTMARSYRRKSGEGKGRLRNGTYQCTVAFTPEQMNWLVVKASFKLVSLAEMIRICVVERMGRADGSAA